MTEKILFIVEGKKDGAFASRLAEVMGLDAHVFPVQANIYMLFSKMKEDEFEINITDALLEMNSVSSEDKETLRRFDPFTYIYLMFDMDPHDNRRSLKANTTIINEMVQRFTDETDNTVGKLYISYPMLEALWDYDGKDAEEYRDRYVNAEDIGRYKSIVGSRGTPNNISKYNLETFKKLGKLNVKKSNWIVNSKWEKPDYTDYVESLGQRPIAASQEKALLEEGKVNVLSGFPLFMIDYWGNTTGFYDSLFE